MKKILLTLLSFAVIVYESAAQAPPPLLRGEVVRLDGSPVANTRVRLLEPDVTGLTDADGLFKIRLPKDTTDTKKWDIGTTVTVLVALENRAVLAKDPHHATALNNLAWHFALRNENLEEALSLSQNSLALAPNQPNYLDTKAEILLRLGRFAEARQANDAARKLTEDADLRKSLDERAEKIAAKLREQR
jgi:tetratricopeptide (TPR) repeat protein